MYECVISRPGAQSLTLAGQFSLSKLIILLRSVRSGNTPDQQARICKEINLQASKVSEDIATERHFMQLTPDGNFFVFDPRYLVFEFTYSLMLRKSQVILVDKVRRLVMFVAVSSAMSTQVLDSVPAHAFHSKQPIDVHSNDHGSGKDHCCNAAIGCDAS
jgi:hypothetical protein